MTAQGTEARKVETNGLDAKREGPVGTADAPHLIPETTMSNEKTITVEQVDREAAAAYLEAKRGYAMGGIIRRGENDDGHIVQAFARHRLAERERCERIAASIEAVARQNCDVGYRLAHNIGVAEGARRIATTIRDTPHAE